MKPHDNEPFSSEGTAKAAIPSFVVQECFAGSIVNSPGCTYGPRLQRELQLVMLQTGSMQIEIDGQRTLVSPGEVFLIMPGCEVYIAFDEKESTWHRWVTIFKFEITVASLGVWGRLPSTLPLSEQMNQLMDVMVSLQKREASSSSTVLHSLALGAFQLYVAEHEVYAASNANPAIMLAKSLVQERYHEELTLADMAVAANVSPGHLTRLFRQYAGIRPKQYLWHYRVERGVELLRTTGLPVGEIAERCGFKTSYHFARSVKAYRQLTPTQIRNGASAAMVGGEDASATTVGGEDAVQQR